MLDRADELDFGPEADTFGEDFHEEGDAQPEEFWDVMGALRAATAETYNALFDQGAGFSGLRKIMPFTKAAKGRRAL
jgi:hypothetical protein